MYQGTTLPQLASEVTRRAAAKRDFVSTTKDLRVDSRVGVLEIAHHGAFAINDLTHRQIATKLSIPAKFYDRMREAHPDILADAINKLFDREPDTRMVRTLDGDARAYLSNRYRRIDNDVVLAYAVQAFEATGMELKVGSCQVTDRRLYLKVTFPQVEQAVKVGDVVRSGVMVANSEVGLGSYAVSPFVERLVCMNGAVLNDYANRTQHIGRRTGDDGQGAEELYADDTLQSDDHTLMLKLRDLIVGMTKPEIFGRIVDKMRVAAGEPITGNPVKAVELLTERAAFTEAEHTAVLRHLIEGADLSRWGLFNAVTATAQDGNTVKSYDRATELETAGGRLLALPDRDWSELAQAN